MNGEMLWKRVKKLGYTQKQLAEKLGITRQAVCTRFKASVVSTDFISELSNMLNQPVEYFFTGNINDIVEKNLKVEETPKAIDGQPVTQEISNNILILQLEAAKTRILDLEQIIKAKDELISLLINQNK